MDGIPHQRHHAECHQVHTHVHTVCMYVHVLAVFQFVSEHVYTLYMYKCISNYIFIQTMFSFSEAVKMLSDTPMLAPAYFIVGGTKSGEVYTCAYVHVVYMYIHVV